MDRVSFENKNIRFKDKGRGKAVVFLHGFMESLDIWDYFSEVLSKEFRVISIDLPGHGKSECLEKIHTMDLMADCVRAVLDFLNVKECCMVGHSMGGYVTLCFAGKYHEYLKSFCLFHSQAAEDSEAARENRKRTVEAVMQNHYGFISRFIPDLFAPENVSLYNQEIEILIKSAGAMSKEAIISAVEGMKERKGKLNLLSETNLPVLFIAGKKDKRIPLENVMTQAMLPKHCETLILGNVGHMGYIEAKEKTLQAIRCFASRTL